MTDRSWQTWDTSKVIPNFVIRGIEEFDEDLLSPFVQALTALKEALGLIRLALLAEVDPVLAALDLAIQGVQEILETLLTPFGHHVLVVPVMRTNKDVPQLTPLLDWAIPDDYRGSTLQFGEERIKLDTNKLKFYTPPYTDGGGGNWGYFSTLVNSIFDEGDPNRPLYNDNFAVMSFTIITGARNVGDVLKKLFYLMKLLQNFVQVPLDGNLLPVPQNLRLITTAPEAFAPVISADDEESDIVALVRWDRPDLINITDLFLEEVDLEILSTSVYVKKGSKFTNTDVGGLLEDYERLRIEDPFLETRVGVDGLDRDEEYYIAVGYNVQVTVWPTVEVAEDELDAEGQTVEEIAAAAKKRAEIERATEPLVYIIEHYDVSNQVRIRLNERQPPQSNLSGGVFPDWVSSTAPLSIIPGLEDAVRILLATLQILRDQIASPIAELDEFLEDLEGFIAFWTGRLTEISETLRGLAEALKALRVGFSVYGFYTTSGGTNALISEMNSAFFDEAVKNRPQFDGGGDVVAGLTWLSASPGLETLRPLIELYRLLFGDVFTEIDKGEVVSSPEDPDTGLSGESSATDLSEAINSILRVTAEVEQSTEELVEATGLIPDTETSEVEVTVTEVETPCK
jgi:hypothetical protein